MSILYLYSNFYKTIIYNQITNLGKKFIFLEEMRFSKIKKTSQNMISEIKMVFTKANRKRGDIRLCLHWSSYKFGWSTFFRQFQFHSLNLLVKISSEYFLIKSGHDFLKIVFFIECWKNSIANRSFCRRKVKYLSLSPSSEQ